LLRSYAPASSHHLTPPIHTHLELMLPFATPLPQANYRAVIRAHKSALNSLKSFWQLLLHSDVSMTRLQVGEELAM